MYNHLSTGVAMNSERIYNEIINRALLRGDINSYTESHHIKPKCIGGDDSADNLVLLTGREHYVCHWLLCKIYDNSKLVFAWNMMCNNLNGKRYTSRTFAYARSAWASEMAKLNRGRVFSDETKSKMRAAKVGLTPWNKGVKTGKNSADIKRAADYEANPKKCKVCYGKIDYHVRNARTYCSNKCAHSDPENPMIKARDSAPKRANSGTFKKGNKVSAETAGKISAKLKGIKRPRGICPHCNTEGAISLLKRWHFDNCKEK